MNLILWFGVPKVWVARLTSRLANLTRRSAGDVLLVAGLAAAVYGCHLLFGEGVAFLAGGVTVAFLGWCLS